MKTIYDSNAPNGRDERPILETRPFPSLKLNHDELPENLTLGLNPHVRDLANSGVFNGKLPTNTMTIIPCPVGCCRGRRLRVHKIGTHIYISLYSISTGRLLLRFLPSVVDIDEAETAVPKPRNGAAV